YYNGILRSRTRDPDRADDRIGDLHVSALWHATGRSRIRTGDDGLVPDAACHRHALAGTLPGSSPGAQPDIRIPAAGALPAGILAAWRYIPLHHRCRSPLF